MLGLLLLFLTNLAQFNMDIVKINFAMTYLTEVAQDQFEIGLNQEDQGILQDWLSDWNLFVDKLCQHFGLSDSVGEVANMLDNLHIKPGNKISTYNLDFMCYASQLGWENSCYGSRLKGLSQETTLVLSNTRELDKVPSTKQSTLYTNSPGLC